MRTTTVPAASPPRSRTTRPGARLLLAVVIAACSLAALAPAPASAARFARAAEARSIFLQSPLGRECAAAERRGDTSTCAWTLPIMSTRNRGWALLYVSYVDTSGNALFDASGFVRRRGKRWVQRGSLQDPCRAPLPAGFRAELRLDCTDGSSVNLPRLPVPARLIGAADTLHARPGREATIGTLRRWLRRQPPSQRRADGRCTTSWRRAALVATTYGSKPCSAGSRPLEITARRGWYTARGLTPGLRTSVAARLYPARYSYGGNLALPGEVSFRTASVGPLRVTAIRNGISVTARVSHGVVRSIVLGNEIGD